MISPGNARENPVVGADEVVIGEVPLSQVRGRVRWPLMRMMAPRFVEQVELQRYVRELLRSGRWSRVRVAPHPRSVHVYDVYGVPRLRADVPAAPRNDRVAI
jgi:hypothetical protein